MSEENVERTTEIYEWINVNYIENILKAYEKIDCEILDHSVRHATSKGQNFVGTLFRVVVKYKLKSDHESIKTTQFIIKANQEENAEMIEMLEDINVFQRESQVYKVILSECHTLLQSINDPTIIGPRLIYVDERSIVLEDLSVKGYAMKDCRKRLNLDECKLVLEKVAKFHACTAVLNEKKPDIFKFHRKGNINEKFTPFHLVYQNSVQSCIRYAKTIPELQKYIDKLDKFAERIIPALIKVYSVDTSESITVLNHGDLWINNFLFNEKMDPLLVDYQEGFYGSPGIDLNWFIYTTCEQDILSNNLDELLQFYQTILAETLDALCYKGKIPSLKNIEEEIRRKSDHGLATLLCMVPIMIMENKEYAEPRYIISDDEESSQIRDIIFKNDTVRQLLIDNLPNFVKNGQL